MKNAEQQSAASWSLLRIVRRRGMVFDEPLESEYREDFFRRSIGIVRIALLLAFALYALFGILDTWIVPSTRNYVWVIRYAMVCPLIGLIFAFTYMKWFQKAMQFLLSFTALLLGVGILAIIALAQKEELGRDYYYAGLMLVIMWTYTLVRLRFVYACLVSWLITIAYQVVAIFFQDMLGESSTLFIFINNNFFFISSNIIGMFASFTIEFYLRKDFLQRIQIHAEQKKSDRLLLNILPEPIAQELKRREGTIADAFAGVTVLFADLAGFTTLSRDVSPHRLVKMLNKIFSVMDTLAEKYGLEKIKTIGDAYMVVGGLPEPAADHATRIADFALELMSIARRFRRKSGERVPVRIGINSGPVVAGVIGIKKFTYDLWGDTVNIAARMESQGVIDEIQVSQRTYELLKDRFVFEDRGDIQVKGRGDMRAYLLKGRRDPAARDEDADIESVMLDGA